VKALVANGCDVTVLDNLSSGYRDNLAPFPQVRLIEADVRDSEAVDGAVRGVRVVFHLAASVGNKRSIDDPILDAETNVLGTLRVLEGATRQQRSQIVTSSSAGIFGELRTLPIREDHPVERTHPTAARNSAARSSASRTPNCTGLRPSVFGTSTYTAPTSGLMPMGT